MFRLAVIGCNVSKFLLVCALIVGVTACTTPQPMPGSKGKEEIVEADTLEGAKELTTVSSRVRVYIDPAGRADFLNSLAESILSRNKDAFRPTASSYYSIDCDHHCLENVKKAKGVRSVNLEYKNKENVKQSFLPVIFVTANDLENEIKRAVILEYLEPLRSKQYRYYENTWSRIAYSPRLDLQPKLTLYEIYKLLKKESADVKLQIFNEGGKVTRNQKEEMELEILDPCKDIHRFPDSQVVKQQAVVGLFEELYADGTEALGDVAGAVNFEMQRDVEPYDEVCEKYNASCHGYYVASILAPGPESAACTKRGVNPLLGFEMDYTRGHFNPASVQSTLYSIVANEYEQLHPVEAVWKYAKPSVWVSAIGWRGPFSAGNVEAYALELETMAKEGAVFIFAAGNSGDELVLLDDCIDKRHNDCTPVTSSLIDQYPENFIIVSGIGSEGGISDNSSKGAQVGLAASFGKWKVGFNADEVLVLDGTSYSAPFVGNAIAYIASHLEESQIVESALTTAARVAFWTAERRGVSGDWGVDQYAKAPERDFDLSVTIPRDPQIGHGIVDVTSAMNCIESTRDGIQSSDVAHQLDLSVSFLHQLDTVTGLGYMTGDQGVCNGDDKDLCSIEWNTGLGIVSSECYGDERVSLGDVKVEEVKARIFYPSNKSRWDSVTTIPLTKHIVASGDTLWDLACQNYQSNGGEAKKIESCFLWPLIYFANSVKYDGVISDADILIPGWEIVLPGLPEREMANELVNFVEFAVEHASSR